MPRVSIIIPTHNRSRFMQMAVESVLAQTWRDYEIIIVDDLSTDDTPDVLRQLAQQHEDVIRHVRNAKNLGSAGSRNRGIELARGEVIGFLDDDDIYEPAKLEKQMALLDTTPEASVVYCGYYYIHEDGQHELPAVNLPEGNILKELLLGCPVIMNAPLVRRQCFEQFGVFDPSLQVDEDWEMWLRFAGHGCVFACIKEALCAYRKHSDNKTHIIDVWAGVQLDILDRVFAMPGLQPDVLAMQTHARAHSHITAACAFFARCDFNRGSEYLQRALPEVQRNKAVMDFLAGGISHAALASHVKDADGFIRQACSSIHPARLAHHIESRALARLHFELAHRAYQSHLLGQVWFHGIHTLRNDFSCLIRNRGFASLMLKTLHMALM